MFLSWRTLPFSYLDEIGDEDEETREERARENRAGWIGEYVGE